VGDPFRNLRLQYHRWRNTPIRALDGVRVHSGADQARAVRNGLYKNTYEDGERALLKAVLKPGDRVLEIGGGIGFVGLLATRLAGPGSTVSYEANPKLEPVIRANYALNAAAPELRMRAITPDGKPVTFHQSDNVVSSSLYARAETQHQITVESDALDAALAELKPTVIVMDVEGAEVDLFAGVSLAGVRAMVVELHPHIVGQDRIDALLAGLAEDGFRVESQLRKNVLLRRVA